MCLAGGDHDRIRPLLERGIEAEGIKLNVIVLPVEEIFFRMARHRDFDCAEMSFSSYLISKTRPGPGFVGIPVFPSRKFRHGDIYINSTGPIKKPEDLQGCRIGVPEYQITAAVWIRGILQEYYGVLAEDVHWHTGGTEMPGRVERMRLDLPSAIKITRIPDNVTLLDMLRKGEIDALFSARVPSPLLRKEDWIRRLFPDYRQVEADYYNNTGIFPIMHLVVMKEEVYRQYPWAAPSLYKALLQAREMAMTSLQASAALPVMLPWAGEELAKTLDLMGNDYWPYGLDANRETIKVLIRYMKEQKLLPQEFNMPLESLFAANTLESFGV